MSCLEALTARVSPGPGLPWQMENAGDRKQSPWKEELSWVAASSSVAGVSHPVLGLSSCLLLCVQHAST